MTTARELASCLKAKRNGDGWIALCPAHEDKKPSLSISESEGGKVLTHCHAGCSSEQVWSALHLNGSGRREIAAYPYRDESGKVLYESVRFEPKDFRQRRPDGQGGYDWNLNGTPRKLYRLPELLAAKPGQTVLIVEGERDADNLAQLGLVAITNSGGAGKWRDEYNEPLRGRKVVVVPDNDEPGRKHAAHVAESLQGIAASVKVVELPGLPEKGDATDWLNAGGTVSELRNIVNATAVFKVASPTSEQKDISAPSDEQTLQRLAALPPLEYERERLKAAKDLKCRPATLDKLVNALRPNQEGGLQGRGIDLGTIEPWPEPVNGAAVLNEVAETFSRYLALPQGAADVLAVWCAHAHAFDAFDFSPRLNFTSPEKGCGKTTARDVVGLFVPRPLATENLSVAVLFRVIESQKPTLLADECDAWVNDNDELRGLLNAGHRRGGQALRCEGDGNEVRAFNVFAPAVLCGIGTLPGTLHDRSIGIRLERAKPGEIHQRFDSRRTEEEQKLSRKLARFAADNRAELENCDPELPYGAFNRLADNWRPVFTVAKVAGGDWPRRVTDAFARLVSQADTDAQGLGIMLLTDIQQVFREKKAERLFSKELVDALVAMTDRPWPEARRDKPITEAWLARRLRPFGILSNTLRFDTGRARGYELNRFTDAFSRYLPDQGVSTLASVTTRINIDENENSNRDNEEACHDLKTQETRINIGLSHLGGLKPPSMAVEAYREPTKAEWAAAAKDPAEWDRLVIAAERVAIEHEESLA